MESNGLTVDISNINPIDYYNRYHVQDVFNLLVRLKSVEQTSIDSFTYITNVTDSNKRMIIVNKDTGFFEATMENGLGMAVGEKYSAFMMLQRFIYDRNFYQALSYVMYEVMNLDNEYIRVGTIYYKKTRIIDRYNIKRTELIRWDRPCLTEDNSKKFINSVQKFDRFGIYPDNKKYCQVVDNSYNMYSQFEHEPIAEDLYNGEIDWQWTNILLHHIFGEQYQLGIIYLKVLYDLPRQALPILVLISEERQTGKTTFVDWMTILFGANTVIINPQDIGNQFNGAYADKNIIMIEESHFESRQAMEKLKNLSTQKTILVNSKFIQQFQAPFYGKLIITSNDENKFSKVDDPEIRYWVRKIPTLTGKANHNILEDLKNEIPFFLRFLESLPPVDTSKSRMVFTTDELKTEALALVKQESRSELYKEIETYLENHGMQNNDIEEFYFVAINVKERFFNHNNQYSVSYVNRVLKTEMKLDKIDKATRFIPLETNSSNIDKMIGKPYVWKNPFYNVDISKFDIDKKDVNDDFFTPLGEY